MAPTSSTREHARLVTRALVGDGDTAEWLAASATEWVQQHGESVGSHQIAWVVSRAVTECLSAADQGLTGTTDLAELLRHQPVAGQVAIALATACGYDLETTAQLTRRPVHEVQTLLAPLQVGQAPAAPPSVAPPPPEPIGPKKRRRFRPGLGSIVVLAVLGALVGIATYDGGPRPTLVDAAPPTECQVLANPVVLEVGSSRRPARLALPERVPARLVVDIGEMGQTSEDRAATSGLEPVGLAAGLAVMTLDGSAQAWNVARSPIGLDDVGYLAGAVAEATATGCVNEGSVALVGFGRGAHFAATTTCSGAVSVDILVMARGQYIPSGCRPTTPPSVLVLADANDRTYPPAGGWGIDGPGGSEFSPSSVEEAVAGWGDLAACSGSAPEQLDVDGVRRLTRSGCRTARGVEARIVTGAGHEWPDSLAVEVVDAISSR